jgi:hypothetical protein
MSDIPKNPAAPASVEEMVNASLCGVRERMRHRFQKCEAQIRQSPTASVLGAAGLGYLLHRLPVRAILVTHVRVLSALAPPALLLFGAAKLYEFLQRRDIDTRD